MILHFFVVSEVVDESPESVLGNYFEFLSFQQSTKDIYLIDSKNKYSHFDRIAFETNVWYTEKYSLLRGNLDICVKSF